MTHICSEHLVCTLGCDTSVARLMHELGHLDKVGDDGFSSYHPTWDEVCELTAKDTRLRDGIASWQRFRPTLREDGEFGEVSHMASMQEIGCRCGRADVMFRREGLAEWPEACQRSITTGHKLGSLKVDFDDERTVDDAWRYGIERWNLVCGAVLSVVGYDDNPKIKAIAGRMGSGTLAWSYLANGRCDSQLDQEYNRNMTWRWARMWRVITHEVGHALGLSHTSKAGNIMQPYDSSSITKLGPWDIAEVVKRYGKPADVPVPPPLPPVPPPPGPRPGTPAYGILKYYDAKGVEIESERWDVNRRATIPAGGG